MSRLPIRVRLTLVFAVVMTVVLAALGAFLYLRLGSTLNERVDERLRVRSDALLAAVAASRSATRLDDLRFVGDEEGFAQVVEADGSIRVAFGYAARSQLLADDELRRARDARVVVEHNVKSADGDVAPARLVAVPVAGGSGRVVVVGESLEDRDDALDALRTQLLIALPLALLVSSGIGYLVAAAALRPMEAMRRRAGEISSSTSSRRLPLPAAHDEVHRLGETLNEMLERLDAGLERERRFAADASHELRTPLALLKAELELALRQPRSAGELEEALRSASVETDRLVQLAEDLLLVSRADQGRLPIRHEELDVDELLSSAAGRFERRAADEGRPIQVETADWARTTGRLGSPRPGARESRRQRAPLWGRHGRARCTRSRRHSRAARDRRRGGIRRRVPPACLRALQPARRGARARRDRARTRDRRCDRPRPRWECARREPRRRRGRCVAVAPQAVE